MLGYREQASNTDDAINHVETVDVKCHSNCLVTSCFLKLQKSVCRHH